MQAQIYIGFENLFFVDLPMFYLRSCEK